MSDNYRPGETARPFSIVLVIATLWAGGAERVMSVLAGEWVRRGHRVSLITLGPAGADSYPLETGVKRIGLDVLGASQGPLDSVRRNIQRLSKLRKAIKAENPDVVISFMDSTNVLVLASMSGLQTPVIVSERIDPRHYPIAAAWGWLRRRLYPKAAAVVVQTRSVAEWALEFVPAQKVHVIPNPVVVAGESPSSNYELQNWEAFGAEKRNLPDWLPRGRYVVAMGRLDRQKGYDLLLQAFADLPTEFEDLFLVVMGEGPERLALEKMAVELGIDARVLMPGRLINPTPVLIGATCFVLSSRFEGFPNALLEAMAIGLPVISFSCPSGPADIISHETNGLLVAAENGAELSAAMARVLGNGDLRRSLGIAAQNDMSQYSLECVTDQWDQLFNTAKVI